jgi:hypothetical protein
MLSSLKPFFFNSLKNELCFSDSAGAEAPGIPYERLWNKPLHSKGFTPLQGVSDPGIHHAPHDAFAPSVSVGCPPTSWKLLPIPAVVPRPSS